MTALTENRAAIRHVAFQGAVTGLFVGASKFFESFVRAIAHSRACEAEFDANGRIGPEALRRLVPDV